MSQIYNKPSQSTSKKILPLDDIPQALSALRDQGKKIVHCHGVFDLLHIGHIRHFEQAKTLGEVLVVTVTPDEYVNKGPHRPVFGQDLRAEAVAALSTVDFVAINKWPTAVETIHTIRPSYYVKGSEYKDAHKDRTGGIVLEEEAVNAVGGQLIFKDDVIYSSSNIINRHLSAFSKEVTEYLSGFSERYSANDVIGYLEGSSELKVLVVGETIIDEYQYCEQMGKSMKEPVLAVRYLNMEKYAGGVLAIANHVSSFSNQVGLLTFLGDYDSQEELVRSSLRGNIEPTFLYKKNSPTIVKRRFVESYLFQKLFEVYDMNGEEIESNQSQEFCEILERILPDYDVVIVADYGHGILTPDVVSKLCEKSRFLAVNTQANAGNRGLSTISKYSRADYVTLAGHELAIEERNFRGNLKEMLLNVSRKLSCDRVLVTCGKDGNLAYDSKEGFTQVPAFAGKVVDRMGAGDAVLSLTSSCVAQNAPMEIVAFIANVAGAQAVATLGHQQSLERTPISQSIVSLLK